MKEVQVIDPDYVEALLALREEATGRERVESWLTDHGLSWQDLRAGFLVVGPASVFESAFGVDLSQATTPVHLPVPAELRDRVDSITIPPLPRPT